MSDRLKVLSNSPVDKHREVDSSDILSSTPMAVQNAGTVCLVTLGCSKNLVDSEILLGSLISKGYIAEVDPTKADVILVNTCGFLQSAVEEGIDKILDLAKVKSKDAKLFVAGCMVERYRQDLVKLLPEVSGFITTDELVSFNPEQHNSRQILDSERKPYFLYTPEMERSRSTEAHFAYVKIAEGCDRGCKFCIIPMIRGKMRSRPLPSILQEVQKLIGEGVKEVNFVAQDLTAYGLDLGRGSDEKCASSLLELIRSFDDVINSDDFDSQPRAWGRLFYAYPVGITQELLEALRESSFFCNYLDMPLQHISHSVLKAMGRPLGGKGTRRLIENMLQWMPELALRTTFLVGYPGETDEDVRELEEFIAEGHFAHVGVFSYSAEPESASFALGDEVACELKEERRERLMAAQRKVLDKGLRAYVGKTFPVLYEGFHRESDLLLSARMETQGPEVDGEVIVSEIDDELNYSLANDVSGLFGQFGKVRITDVAGYDFVGAAVA